ncbi:MAG TPA: flagellar hook-length control protein FliK, partial [Nautiliaceae bacterium]|nr:flagellar hook-length control protein FliK [Nautiliaceae bacterium]
EKKTTPIEIKEKIKILINNLKEKEVKEENTLAILQNIINKTIPNNELEKKVNNNPSLKKEIVKITKKIIDAKMKLNKIALNEKEIKEFKEIKTFKKLIEFANKKELNISKIIISSFKPTINNEFNNIILPTNTILDKKINNQNIINNNLTKSSDIAHILNFSLKQKNDKQLNTSKILTNSSITINDLLKNSLIDNKIDTNLKQFTNEPKNNIILILYNKTNINTQQFNKNRTNNTINNLLNNRFIDNKIDTNLLFDSPKKTKTINQPNVSLENLINLDNKDYTKNKKNDNSEQSFNNILSTSQTALDELKLNIIKAKETIKHFSNNIKEAIENYKPPISKISIELNPKELGKVEVTLIHRGDNLQIQINSNNSAISLFNYNQQELKQNLINMGFSDVNMSFNQQNHQQKGNKEYQQNQKFKQKEEDELIIEIPYQYA